MNSHISYVNEISIKDDKIQQNQRGGYKKYNPFYETCRIRNTESTNREKIITPEKSYFTLE